MLSIIVPVRNESENLKSVFDYFNDNLKNLNFEVLIINDFSIDDTSLKAETLAQSYKNFSICNNLKKGLGGAIKLSVLK